MKTWKYLAKGGKIDMMKAFLYHILNNLIIDQYRKHKTNSLDAMVENGFDPSSEETDNIVNTLDAKALVILIKHLPLTYRKVMRMRYVQDMSLSEIALQTGQSANSIAVQSHRGLCKLRSLYMNKGAVSSMALA
jgi:RNA polymerase sigma-70 factor (ECF subfamily)